MKSNKGYSGQPLQPLPRYAFIGNCTKCCLTTINIFLGVLGLSVVLAGAYGLYLSTIAEVRIRVELEFVYLLGTNAAGAMVPVGTALIVVAVAGCIGACQENLPLLKLYMWVLGMFMIVEISVVVGSFLLVWKAEEVMLTSLPRSLIENYRPSTHSVLDVIQSQMHCCGLSVAGYQDYERNPLYNCQDSNQSLQRCSVPGSCCRPSLPRGMAQSLLSNVAVSNDSFNCGQGALLLDLTAARESVYTDGCTGTLTSLLRTLLYAIISVVVLCALIKMYVVYQVRTLLNQIAMLPYNIY